MVKGQLVGSTPITTTLSSAQEEKSITEVNVVTQGVEVEDEVEETEGTSDEGMPGYVVGLIVLGSVSVFLLLVVVGVLVMKYSSPESESF